MVDGYGWPVLGIFDLGWEKVTKFRMDPPFYSVEANMLVNLDKWKSLTDAQRKVLTDAALWVEGLDARERRPDQGRARAAGQGRHRDSRFRTAASQEFLKKANDVAWQAVIAKSPDTGKKLRELAGN